MHGRSRQWRFWRLLQLGIYITAVAELLSAPDVGHASLCAGDCNADGRVMIDELLTQVDISFATVGLELCASGDVNGDGTITINEILAARNNALHGCPGNPPEPTPAPGTAPPPGSGPAVNLDVAVGGVGSVLTTSAILSTPEAVSTVVGVQDDFYYDSSNLSVVVKRKSCIRTRLISCGSDADCTAASGDPTDACLPIPDCAPDPVIAKDASAFAFLPYGCGGSTAPVPCSGVRAMIFSAIDPDVPIPNGAVLYTCQLAVAPTAASGTYPLTLTNIGMGLPNPPGGMPVEITGANGDVIVSPPTATRSIAPTVTPLIPTPTPPPTWTPTNTPRREPNGSACSTDALCQSGHCTQNVCCDASTCPDPQRCDIAGSEGQCADPLGAGQPCHKSTDCTTGLLCMFVGGGYSCSSLPPTPTLPPEPPPNGGCAGDCDGNGSVTVNELVTLVSIALGADITVCGAGDTNADGQITVDEIVAAVDNALNGCPAPAVNGETCNCDCNCLGCFGQVSAQCTPRCYGGCTDICTQICEFNQGCGGYLISASGSCSLGD